MMPRLQRYAKALLDYPHRLRYRQRIDGALTAEQRTAWDRDGFLVLPGFFPGDRLDALADYVDRMWRRDHPDADRIVIDVYVGTPRERRMRMRDAPPEARLHPHKINDLYLESDLVRGLVLDARLAAILGELMGGPALACNTLNFERGSQQDFHTDSLYMTPPRALNLAATWLALEDCHPDAGPLRYYPGSHKIPPYKFSTGSIQSVHHEMPSYQEYMRAEVSARGLQEQRFCAARGDVFIWHSQLYHGGSPIVDHARTRKSLVTHYFLAADVPARHGEAGPGRYYLKRPHQPVPQDQ